MAPRLFEERRNALVSLSDQLARRRRDSGPIAGEESPLEPLGSPLATQTYLF